MKPEDGRFGHLGVLKPDTTIQGGSSPVQAFPLPLTFRLQREPWFTKSLIQLLTESMNSTVFTEVTDQENFPLLAVTNSAGLRHLCFNLPLKTRKLRLSSVSVPVPAHASLTLAP